MSVNKHYLIAYSGGLDSHVLLHKMATKRAQDSSIQLRAIHVHHGLNPQADTWAAHCKSVCVELAIPLLLKKVVIPCDTGDSLEALARRERYRIIAECLEEDESLMTGHTLDDQAETLLLQLLRGAGPKGLSAMPEQKPFSHGFLLRPLLNTSRENLEAYAEQHQLEWVEDDSNQDLRFDRNYLRHRILPLLKERWPAALNNLARSAEHCAQAAELLETLADKDLLSLQGAKSNTLSVAALLALSIARRRNALRQWCRLQADHTPSTQQLIQCETDILQADKDAAPVMSISDLQLRRYRDDLYLLLPIEPFDTSIQLIWDLQSPLMLPGNLGELKPEPHYRQYNNITVRFRQGGEHIKLAYNASTQSLKKLFQSWGVPTWERDRIPLIFSDDRLVAIVGYFNPQFRVF